MNLLVKPAIPVIDSYCGLITLHPETGRVIAEFENKGLTPRHIEFVKHYLETEGWAEFVLQDMRTATLELCPLDPDVTEFIESGFYAN